MRHIRYECKHGVVVRQCRCPERNKAVRIVECPTTCLEKTDNG